MGALKCLSFQTVNTDYLQVPDCWSVLRLGRENPKKPARVRSVNAGAMAQSPKISLDELAFINVQSVQTSFTYQFAYLCGNRNYTLVTQEFKCTDCYSKVQKFSLPIFNYTDIGDSKTHIYLVTLCRKEKQQP